MNKKYVQTKEILDLFSACSSISCGINREEFFGKYVFEKNSNIFLWEIREENKVEIEHCFFCFLKSHFKNLSSDIFVEESNYNKILNLVNSEITNDFSIDIKIDIYLMKNEKIENAGYFQMKGSTEIEDEEKTMQGVMYFVESEERPKKEEPISDIRIHDIKNQMMMLMAYAENIQKEANSTIIKQNIIYIKETIYSCANMLSRLYKNEKIKIEMETKDELININNVINLITESFVSEYNIDIQKKYNAENTRIYADKTLIQNLLYNIVLNAVQSCENSGRIKIKTYNRKNEDDAGNLELICIEVSDNGKGIKKDELKMIFQKDYTTKEKGMGLGLHSAKQTIEMYGGEIFVKSNPRWGATFIILLPCHVE